LRRQQPLKWGRAAPICFASALSAHLSSRGTKSNRD
jgi:hypothetical protein